jgi:AmmeMemoRadiSam system protein A
MSPLSSDDRRALLDLARRAIVEAVSQHDRLLDLSPATGALADFRAAFVTLHHRGRLRGCIGNVEPDCSLAETVARSAISAARHDPRFSAVEVKELAELEIEISVLSPFKRIALAEVEIGRHGLMIVQGERRGLLLPQVAVEHKFSRERFLAATCEKAGLPSDAWMDPATQILAFTAEIFSDRDSSRPDPRSAA